MKDIKKHILMHTLEPDKTPNSGESLADYIQRLRTSIGLSQKELATKAGIHLQSLGKMERGKTAKLNRKTQNGLAIVHLAYQQSI